ncbi:MAG: hypothetical protein ACFFD4_36640 [Candidatus Odinarchaeota archaeon]
MSKRQAFDQQKKVLEAIFSNFLPVSFSVRNKQIELSEESLLEIERAIEAVELSNKNGIPLPHTTRDLATYGNVTKQIFENKADYLVETSASRLSKRSGSWSFKIMSWDKRKIENELKKGKEKPKCKSDKDKKVLAMFLATTKEYVLTENFVLLENALNEHLPLFVHTGNPETEHIYRVQRELNKISGYLKNLEEINNRLEESNSNKESIQKELNAINSLIAETRQKFSESITGSHLGSLEEEKARFLKNDELSKYLKLLSNFIHALCAGLEKQQLLVDFPQNKLFMLEDDLLAGDLEMSEYNQLIETLYNNHHIYTKQAWYKKVTADNPEMIKKRLFVENNVEDFFKLRELNRKIIEVTMSDAYKEFNDGLSDLIKKRNSLEDQQAIIETSIKTVELERLEFAERYKEALELLKGLYREN